MLTLASIGINRWEVQTDVILRRKQFVQNQRRFNAYATQSCVEGSGIACQGRFDLPLKVRFTMLWCEYRAIFAGSTDLFAAGDVS